MLSGLAPPKSSSYYFRSCYQKMRFTQCEGYEKNSQMLAYPQYPFWLPSNDGIIADSQDWVGCPGNVVFLHHVPSSAPPSTSAGHLRQDLRVEHGTSTSGIQILSVKERGTPWPRGQESSRRGTGLVGYSITEEANINTLAHT